MTPEEEILLILSRPRPSEKARKCVQELTAQGSVDYERLLRVAARNGVSPLIYRNLTGDEGVPEGVKVRLKAAYYQTLRRNLGHMDETLRILGLLSGASIVALPLKGSLAAERFFGDAGMYPTSDIDILIRPEDLTRARQILEASGYRNAENMDWEDLKTGTYHAVLTNGDYHIELHWNLTMRYFRVGPDFWWQKTSRTVHDGKEILLLDSERYLLYLIFRAFAKGFFPLKYLVLAAGLIEASRRDFDWDDFFRLSESCRMERVAAFTLSFLQSELGIDCPGAVAGQRHISYRLFRRLVISGLFTFNRRIHLRMLLYTFLLQSPDKSIAVLLRRLFPSSSEIRLRYGLQPHSNSVYLYYLLNPILLATRKHKTESR